MHGLLEDSDIGYRVRDYASLRLSVVGGRPFSNGGRSRGGARNLYKSKFYRFHYGVRTLEQSSRRIVDATRDAKFSQSTVVLAHHGPLGLGDAPSDPCGCDWDEALAPLDWGDADLGMALDQVKALPDVRVPLVVFGHMDGRLQGSGGERTMAVQRGKTTFVNAAVCPRWRGVRPGKASRGVDTSATERAFTLIDLGVEADGAQEDACVDARDGPADSLASVPWAVTCVRQAWILPSGDVREERRLLSY